MSVLRYPCPHEIDSVLAGGFTVSVLRLKKREDRRVLSGHQWVFSNEIDNAYSPLKDIEPGQAVRLEAASGRFLAYAYANPHSLIAARITSRNQKLPFNSDVLQERLQQALALREHRFEDPYYRLAFSEGDFLPGLIVDRYADVFVVQITTAGMEQFKDVIVDSLCSITEQASVYLRNDTSVRELEQLPSYREWAFGDPVQELQVVENQLRFSVPAEISQKTGWFFDHRESRAALAPWVSGKRVLDVYTYVGGFGINAARMGAASVLALDSSQAAISAAQHNAALNGVEQLFSADCADAVEGMRGLYEQGESFDVIILDPPAFIKRRKDRDAGLRHYGLNHRLAMRLLAPGGVLFSASCSQLLSQSDLLQQAHKAVPKDRLGLQILAPLQQAADHPINAAMPETRYLSGAVVRAV